MGGIHEGSEERDGRTPTLDDDKVIPVDFLRRTRRAPYPARDEALSCVETLLTEGRGDEAAAELRTLRERCPGDPFVLRASLGLHLAACREAYAAGRLDGVVTHAREVLRFDPLHPVAYAALLRSSLLLGKPVIRSDPFFLTPMSRGYDAQLEALLYLDSPGDVTRLARLADTPEREDPRAKRIREYAAWTLGETGAVSSSSAWALPVEDLLPTSLADLLFGVADGGFSAVAGRYPFAGRLASLMTKLGDEPSIHFALGVAPYLRDDQLLDALAAFGRSGRLSESIRGRVARYLESDADGSPPGRSPPGR